MADAATVPRQRGGRVMAVKQAALLERARGGPLPFLLLWMAAAPFLLFPTQLPAATLLAAALLAAGLFVLRRRGVLPPTAFDGLLLLYLFLASLALLSSPQPAESLRRLTTLYLGIGGFFGLVAWLATGKTEQKVATLIRLLPLLAAGLALLGLVTVRWPSRYFLDLGTVTGRLPHLGGSFEIHHNTLAGVLVLLVLPAFFAWRALPGSGARAVLAAATLLVLSALVLTQSRNGLLSLAAGLAGGWLWQRGRFRPLLVLFALLLLLPPLLGSLPGESQEPVRHSLVWLDGESKLGPVPEQSWLARLELWSAALHLMRDYPVLGAGLYQFEQASRANEVYRSIRPDLALSHAHNLWLQSGAGLGWPGWLAAAVLWLGVLYYLGRATESAPPHARWLGTALGASLCGYLAFNSFDVLAPEMQAGLLVWPLLALTAVFVHGHFPVWRQSRWRRLPFAPLALLILLLPWLPRNLANLQLDHARLVGAAGPLPVPAALAADDHRRLGLLYALQGREAEARDAWRHDREAVLYLESQGLRAIFHDEDPEAALAWYARALALDPAAGTVLFWQGQAYEQLGQDRAALAAYRRAVVHGDEEVWFGHRVAGLAWERQGRILVEQNAWTEARDAFAAAVALAPEVADYRQQLADVQRMLEELRQAGNE